MAVIQGAKKFRDKLDRLGDVAKAKISAATIKSAERMAGDMKLLVPKDTGNLMESIKIRQGFRRDEKGRLAPQRGNEISVAVTAGGRGAAHAHLVEFGTSPHVNGGIFAGSMHPGTDPQPFFYPAYRSNLKRVKSAVRRALNSALKNA